MYYPHRIHLVCTVLLLGLTVCAHAREDDAVQALSRWIEAHQATEWSGGSELWLDPAGNDAELSDARLRVESERITYTWSYKRTEQTGEIGWTDAGLVWKDTWHQPENVLLRPLPRHGGLLAGAYSYPAGDGPDWHWRVNLAQRPDGTLVLQMTNIAPWGEEARAVRMVFRQQDPEQ